MSKKVLVTGGCGFVGSHLVHLLVQEGYHVRCLDLPAVSRENLKGIDFEDYEGDIRSEKDVRKALKGMEWLFHTAGNPNLWAPDKRIFHSVNFVGTQIVLNVASECELERVIYTSTESILVPSRHSGPIREDSDPYLAEMIGPYCRSKFLAEQVARQN